LASNDGDFKPVSFRDFMTNNLVSLAQSIKKVDDKFTDYLFTSKFDEFVVQIDPKIDKLYQEIERLNGETLKSELGI
jgi:hypothetical protein